MNACPTFAETAPRLFVGKRAARNLLARSVFWVGLTSVAVLHGVLLFLPLTSLAPAAPHVKPLSIRMLAPAVPAPESSSRPALAKPHRSTPKMRPALPELRQVAAADAPIPLPEVAPSSPAVTAVHNRRGSEAPVVHVAQPAELAVSGPRFDADYLHNPPPTYPAIARRMGEEGRVVLRVFVEADGAPGQIEIREGSGSPRLDGAAVQTVRRWRFVPARRGSEALGAWVNVPIVFNLKG